MLMPKNHRQLPAHGLLPAKDFAGLMLGEERGTKAILQIRPRKHSRVETFLRLVSLPRPREFFPVVLHGYKEVADVHTATSEYDVVVSPALADSRNVNLGLEGLELVPGLVRDEHPNRFPWCRLQDYFGSNSLIWREYERRRLCEQAEKTVLYSQRAVYRYLAQGPFMTESSD